MKKIFKLSFACLFILIFSIAVSQPSLAADKLSEPTDNAAVDNATSSAMLSDSGSADVRNESKASAPEIAQAVVLKILAEKEVKNDDGSKSKQQNLELKILTGPLAGQTEQYIGISDIQVTSTGVYKPGDKVVVNYSRDDTGNYNFYVTDYVRSGALLWLLFFFVIVVLIVGQWKGLRALLSFFLSFLFIIYAMVPLFLLGWNPAAIGMIGALVILLLIIYLTEGYNRKSHVASLGIAVSLFFTAILSAIFIAANHLTGITSDEVTYLIGSTNHPMNFKGLLLAAIFIGVLGILDDVVMGQVESVLQIKTANPYLKEENVFNMAMKVGQSHLGAIINTLFLAYIGTALPLILLIGLHQQPFATFSDVINNEQVATEVVRTLVGVIGLCSAIPISTWLAAKYLKVVGEPVKKNGVVSNNLNDK